MKSKKSYLASIIISILSAFFLVGCAQEQAVQPAIIGNYPGNVSGQNTGSSQTVSTQASNILSGVYDGKLLRTNDAGAKVEQAMTMTINMTSQQGTLILNSPEGPAFAATNIPVPILLVGVDYTSGYFYFVSKVITDSTLFEGSMALLIKLQMGDNQINALNSEVSAYDCVYPESTYCGDLVDDLGFSLTGKR